MSTLLDKINKLKEIVSKMRYVNPYVDTILAQDDNLKVDGIKILVDFFNETKDKVNYGKSLDELNRIVMNLRYVKDCPFDYWECLKKPDYYVPVDLHKNFYKALFLIYDCLKKASEQISEINPDLQTMEMYMYFLYEPKLLEVVTSSLHNAYVDLFKSIIPATEKIYKRITIPTWVKAPLTFKFFPFHYISNNVYDIENIVESDYVNDPKYHTATYDVEADKFTEQNFYTIDIYVPCYEHLGTPICIYADTDIEFSEFIIGKYIEETGECQVYHRFYSNWYNMGFYSQLSSAKYIYTYVYVRTEGNYLKRITVEIETDTGFKIPTLQIKWNFLNKNKVEWRIRSVGYSEHYISERAIFGEYDEKLNAFLLTFLGDATTREVYHNTCFDFSFIVRYLSDFDCWIPDFEYSTTPTIEDYSNDTLLYSNTLHDVTIEQVGTLKYFDKVVNLDLTYGDGIELFTIYDFYRYSGIYLENDYWDPNTYYYGRYFNEYSHGRLFLGKENDIIKRVTIETTEGYVVQYIYNPNNIQVNSKVVKEGSILEITIWNEMDKYFNWTVFLWITFNYYSPRFPNLYMTYKIPLQHIPDEIIHISL